MAKNPVQPLTIAEKHKWGSGGVQKHFLGKTTFHSVAESSLCVRSTKTDCFSTEGVWNTHTTGEWTIFKCFFLTSSVWVFYSAWVMWIKAVLLFQRQTKNLFCHWRNAFFQTLADRGIHLCSLMSLSIIFLSFADREPHIRHWQLSQG